MTDEEFHQTICSSERARRLLAASIRYAARARLGVTVDAPSAERLARVHTVGSAIAAIQEKLRLYHDLPRATKDALAINEASIDGYFGGDQGHRTASIITMRRTALNLDSATERENETFAGFQRSMWRVQAEISEWTKLVSSFLRGYENLYQEASRFLDRLGLPEPIQSTAKGELEQLFSAALDEFFEDLNSRK